jgi:hypothetical protein
MTPNGPQTIHSGSRGSPARLRRANPLNGWRNVRLYAFGALSY